MNIEVHTTTVKLTKSIINQMPLTASLHHLRSGIVLGYVLNIVKGSHKTLLIRCDGNYHLLDASWRLSSSRPKYIDRPGIKGTLQKSFNSPEERDEFWALYQKALSGAQQIYI